MPATVTLRQIEIELAERYSFGTVLRNIDPDNVAGTSVTLLDATNAGPETGASIPINSAITFVDPVDTGTATASTTTTVTDSSKAWTASEWIGFRIIMGGWQALITANDATSVTFAALDEAPTIGIYTIEYGSSRVSNFVASTGVLSLNPTLGTLNAAQTNPFTAIYWNTDVRHADRVKDAVNRALQNRIGRWELRPLTYVPDGDLQGVTVTDYWTAAANGTAAYVTAQVFPAGSAADAFGQVGVNRLLQLTTSGGGSSSLTGNGIRVQVSTQQRTWKFFTAIRLVSGTGTAAFVVRDNTNAADITLQVTRGNDSNTLSVTTLGDFMVCEGSFQLPATCAEIAPRLTLSAASLVAQMAPVIMYPTDAYAFPLPNRIETNDQIGNFYWGLTSASPGGFAHSVFSEPLTAGGCAHRIIDYGDHRTVTFSFHLVHPVWYEEYVNGAALSGMADTTSFPLERIAKWAAFELYDRLMREEMQRRARLENGAVAPSVWRPLRNAAYKSAQFSPYEPELKNVVGRRV